MRLPPAFVIAFSMYSKIPMPRQEWKPEDMKYVMCWFPFVGAVLGGLFRLWCVLVQYAGFGTALFCAGAVALPVLVTGGIHLDGFCDTSDALASYGSREKKLEILKDPHTGAFALIACCVYFAVTLCLFAELSRTVQAINALALGFFFSRILSGLSVVLFPNAKKDGLLAGFAQTAERKRTRNILIGMGMVCAVLLILCGKTGAALLAAALLTFIHYYFSSKRIFGGTTGDLAGWFLQRCELFSLLAVVLVQKF